MAFPFQSDQTRSTPYVLNFIFAGAVQNIFQSFTVANNGTAYIQIKTPPDYFVHITSRQHGVSTNGTGEAIFDLVEAPTLTDGATPVEVNSNVNRNSAKLLVPAIYNDPTAVTGGTVIARDYVYGSGNKSANVVGALEALERLLLKDTDYVVQIDNNTGQSAVITTNLILYASSN
jgi:hypothetical protein